MSGESLRIQEGSGAACQYRSEKEEEGLLALAARWEIPFSVFSEEELLKARGEFTSSAFVKSITGVENVCERSAVTAAAQGILIEKIRSQRSDDSSCGPEMGGTV